MIDGEIPGQTSMRIRSCRRGSHQVFSRHFSSERAGQPEPGTAAAGTVCDRLESGDGTASLSLRGVSKGFGNAPQAVRNVSLDILEGEFFSLLGPSGCGKTTTLRLLAGFEQPDTGSIFLRGIDVTPIPPNRRNVNLVFQNYELFPHMNVYDNVAYGLKLRKTPRKEEQERVGEMLRVVRLGGFEERFPRQLSGGQQQRVALARALVNRPAALLLDEPLSALDVKLRKQMQQELKSIQHVLRTTFVYVTHDQEEALSMSDRIGVMNDGTLLQIGSPREIYERPVDDFVANFIGSLNVFQMRVAEVTSGFAMGSPNENDRVSVQVADDLSPGAIIKVAIRPERVVIDAADRKPTRGDSYVEGSIADITYLGSATQFHVKTDSFGEIVSQRVNEGKFEHLVVGSRVVLSWPVEAALVLSTSVAIG